MELEYGHFFLDRMAGSLQTEPTMTTSVNQTLADHLDQSMNMPQHAAGKGKGKRSPDAAGDGDDAKGKPKARLAQGTAKARQVQGKAKPKQGKVNRNAVGPPQAPARWRILKCFCLHSTLLRRVVAISDRPTEFIYRRVAICL